MNGFSRLAFVEAKLFGRDRVAAIAVFAVPVAIVVGFGLQSGMDKPKQGLGGQIGMEYLASVGVALGLAILSLIQVPQVIGQYREQGILRRLGATPVRPATLLIAKLAVWAAVAVVSVLLIAAVARFGYHVPVPVRLGWFAVTVILGIAAMLALGMLAAAAAPNARAATGIGMLLYLPSLFLAGVFQPSNQMSGTLQRIGNYTPLGAVLHAVRDTWMGRASGSENLGLAAYLGIMAAYAVVVGLAAARFFRWEQSGA